MQATHLQARHDIMVAFYLRQDHCCAALSVPWISSRRPQLRAKSAIMFIHALVKIAELHVPSLFSETSNSSSESPSVIYHAATPWTGAESSREVSWQVVLVRIVGTALTARYRVLPTVARLVQPSAHSRSLLRRVTSNIQQRRSALQT